MCRNALKKCRKFFVKLLRLFIIVSINITTLLCNLFLNITENNNQEIIFLRQFCCSRSVHNQKILTLRTLKIVPDICRRAPRENKYVHRTNIVHVIVIEKLFCC